MNNTAETINLQDLDFVPDNTREWFHSAAIRVSKPGENVSDLFVSYWFDSHRGCMVLSYGSWDDMKIFCSDNTTDWLTLDVAFGGRKQWVAFLSEKHGEYRNSIAP